MIRKGSRSMMTTMCNKMIKILLIRHMIYMLEKIVMSNTYRRKTRTRGHR